jgi:MoxR-like ATPase
MTLMFSVPSLSCFPRATLQGVLYGLTRHGRVLIADEMGVGKTVQALALAACYQVCVCVGGGGMP